MIKRLLGKTGMEVSEVAFGGVEIGIPYGIGVDSAEDMITERDALQLLQASLDAGINFYDTARQYGKSEYLIGKAFEGRRSEVILCTKCTHFLHDDNRIPPYAELKKIVESSLRQSLEALQTDYIDVFMLHQGNMEILENDDVSQVLTDLKKSGIIRATGVSTYEPEETLKAADSGVYDVIQLPFNLLDQRQASIFPLLSEQGIGIVVRSVLMKGLLSDRGKDLHPALQDVQSHIQKYLDLTDGAFDLLPALAMHFALSFPQVSSILVGLDRERYLHACLAVANGYYLDKARLERARSLAYPEPEFLNLHRWSKMGWLK